MVGDWKVGKVGVDKSVGVRGRRKESSRSAVTSLPVVRPLMFVRKLLLCSQSSKFPDKLWISKQMPENSAKPFPHCHRRTIRVLVFRIAWRGGVGKLSESSLDSLPRRVRKDASWGFHETTRIWRMREVGSSMDVNDGWSVQRECNVRNVVRCWCIQ